MRMYCTVAKVVGIVSGALWQGRQTSEEENENCGLRNTTV